MASQKAAGRGSETRVVCCVIPAARSASTCLLDAKAAIVICDTHLGDGFLLVTEAGLGLSNQFHVNGRCFRSDNHLSSKVLITSRLCLYFYSLLDLNF